MKDKGTKNICTGIPVSISSQGECWVGAEAMCLRARTFTDTHVHTRTHTHTHTHTHTRLEETDASVSQLSKANVEMVCYA